MPKEKEKIIEIWRKIKHWFWWNFKATNKEKIYWQQMIGGVGIGKMTKKGLKFIDIKKFREKIR